MPFIPHNGAGKYQSYLSLNLPYAPIKRLRKEVEAAYGVTLKSRGEAHITVVTPPEYDKLKAHIEIDAINELVMGSVQFTPFEIICLGRGVAYLGNKSESTYFLVVTSRGLDDIRHLIHREFMQAGGDSSALAREYTPHITIGFTQRDLHAQDGVSKNETSCIAPVTAIGK